MLNYNYVYTRYIIIKSFDILFTYFMYQGMKKYIPNELKCRQYLPRIFHNMVS